MYRNNLVRTTLSVFVACTLLYTASASAQSSTQLNPPALTPEFSDAPVATSLGPLLSEDITSDESYTPEVITMRQATATEEAPTMTLAQAEPELPQLDTPTRFSVELAPSRDDSITISWNYIGSFLSIVEKYKVNLYLGTDTNGEVLHAEEHTRVRVNNPSNAVVFLMFAYTPATQYTIELIVQATGHEDSNPLTETVMTRKFSLDSPTRNELVITPSTDNITVIFENTQSGVDGYALSIRKRFDDLGIAQSTEDFSIGESPVTFTNLVPNRAYTLMALPTFESERYEYSGGIVSLDFATRNLLLSNPRNVTASFVARRRGSLTIFNVRIAWESVENAQSYSLKSYDNNISFSTEIGEVFAPETETLASADFLFVSFRTIGIRAESDIYINSEEVFAPILPPKLSSEFFIVTPSSTSLSLTWDSSRDASLQTGGDSFYDSTFIGRLGSSASSLLLISIEDLDGNQIAEPEEVGTGADTYSRGGLSDATRYVVKIVHRVTVGDTSRSSEALEIKFIASTSLRLRLRAFLEGPLQ